MFLTEINFHVKDLASSQPLEIGIAVNGLSHIVTPDLARDLCQDLVAMLNHSRPYIRKKVVLVLYKVFLKFPEALRVSFPRLKEKLEDADPCKCFVFYMLFYLIFRLIFIRLGEKGK